MPTRKMAAGPDRMINLGENSTGSATPKLRLILSIAAFSDTRNAPSPRVVDKNGRHPLPSGRGLTPVITSAPSLPANNSAQQAAHCQTPPRELEPDRRFGPAHPVMGAFSPPVSPDKLARYTFSAGLHIVPRTTSPFRRTWQLVGGLPPPPHPPSANPATLPTGAAAPSATAEAAGKPVPSKPNRPRRLIFPSLHLMSTLRSPRKTSLPIINSIHVTPPRPPTPPPPPPPPPPPASSTNYNSDATEQDNKYISGRSPDARAAAQDKTTPLPALGTTRSSLGVGAERYYARWTPREDAILRLRRGEVGVGNPPSFEAIARAYLPGRTAEACRFRYYSGMRREGRGAAAWRRAARGRKRRFRAVSFFFHLFLFFFCLLSCWCCLFLGCVWGRFGVFVERGNDWWCGW